MKEYLVEAENKAKTYVVVWKHGRKLQEELGDVTIVEAYSEKEAGEKAQRFLAVPEDSLRSFIVYDIEKLIKPWTLFITARSSENNWNDSLILPSEELAISIEAAARKVWHIGPERTRGEVVECALYQLFRAVKQLNRGIEYNVPSEGESEER